QDPKEFSVDRYGGQDGGFDPLFQEVLERLYPAIGIFEALLHIGNGQVPALLHKGALGIVAEYGVAGFGHLVVEDVALHPLSIDLEKIIGPQIVTRKADLDVLEPEEGSEG